MSERPHPRYRASTSQSCRMPISTKRHDKAQRYRDGKLKRFKRVALRCEKTAQNYGSVVALALGFILVKSVHTA